MSYTIKNGNYNFIGIANATPDYVAGAKSLSKDLTKGYMGSNGSMSVNDFIKMCDEKGISYNRDTVNEIANADGKGDMTLDKVSVFVMACDGKYDPNLLMYKFDGNIESESEPGGDLNGTIEAKGDKFDIYRILDIFGVKRASENSDQSENHGQYDNSDPSGDSGIFTMPQGTRYAVFSLESAKATY